MQAPLVVPREQQHRIVGTCRHFAVLARAPLRHRRIEARVRCGFATYFQPGQALDHWITEYRTGETAGWVRVDPEVLGGTILAAPENLLPDQFLSGGEACLAFRRGQIDADRFGVYGTTTSAPPRSAATPSKTSQPSTKSRCSPANSGRQAGVAVHTRTIHSQDTQDAVRHLMSHERHDNNQPGNGP